MANSFNISFKPDIAALDAKVVLVDAVVDAIRATDVPDIQTNINANETKIDANSNDLGHIRNTAIPNVITEINANETKIDVCDAAIDQNYTYLISMVTNYLSPINGIVDAIKLKTDATPQNVRGVLTKGRTLTSSGTFVDVVNVTGHGKLHSVSFNPLNLNDTVEVNIAVDGVARTITHTGDAVQQSINISCDSAVDTVIFLTKIPLDVGNIIHLINLDFAVSLLIQVRRSAGANDSVRCAAIYSLDTF